MHPSRFLSLLAAALLPLALLSTTWLYLYPIFHGCAFPVPPPSTDLTEAPFRLLALGDPQLEGDSSLPDPSRPAFPSLDYLLFDLQHAGTWSRRRSIVSTTAKEFTTRDLPKWIEGYRKRLDLWGNDYYLAHIVRGTRWWARPTHVAVLGDLLGSQWIKDEEFERRAGRYWGKVFKGMEMVPWGVMDGVREEVGEGERAGVRRGNDGVWGGTREVLGEDRAWSKRVINIAGNHDIGYAGDLDEKRVERFERAFGRVNWDITFELPLSPQSLKNTTDASFSDNHAEDAPQDCDTEARKDSTLPPPTLHLTILNSMNLDTPAISPTLQSQTYSFVNHLIANSLPVTSKRHTTILLTHIPLHKDPGTCIDSPFFSFFNSENGGGVKEQNMLSDYASWSIVLEGLFGLSGNPFAEGGGLGRSGVVINGHDHEGCDVLHYIPREGSLRSRDERCARLNDVPTIRDLPVDADTDSLFSSPNSTSESTPPPSPPSPDPPSWRALPFSSSLTSCINASSTPHLREITLRSMMGDFSGHAGFLSAWFDESLGEAGEWKIEFGKCALGVQHWWWAVHVLDVILLGVVGAAVLAWVLETVGGWRTDTHNVGRGKVGKGRDKDLSNGGSEKPLGKRAEKEKDGKNK